MLTKEQAKIVSDMLLEPDRERLNQQIAARVRKEAVYSKRKKARAIGGILGEVIGIGLYLAFDRLVLMLIVAPILGCLLADLLLAYKARQNTPTDTPASRPHG